MFLPIAAGISAKDQASLQHRFDNIHADDIREAVNNRIAKIATIRDKNVAHQQPINAGKSVLDEPFSITDILKSLDTPRAAKFTKEFPNSESVAYRCVYEFEIDQCIGRRFIDHDLDCNILTAVLVNSDAKTYRESGGKNVCLLSFSCHPKETLPLQPDGFSSNANGIVKLWTGNTLNHRNYLVSRQVPRPRDNRRLGAPLYNNCHFPGCYSCDPNSPEQKDPGGYRTGASSSATASAAPTPFNQPNPGGYPTGASFSATASAAPTPFNQQNPRGYPTGASFSATASAAPTPFNQQNPGGYPTGNPPSTTFQPYFDPTTMYHLQQPPNHHLQPPEPLSRTTTPSRNRMKRSGIQPK